MKCARASVERDLKPSNGVEIVVVGELGPRETDEVLEIIRRIRDKHRARLAGQPGPLRTKVRR